MDLGEARARRAAEARALAVPLEVLVRLPALPEPAVDVIEAAARFGLSVHVLRNAISDGRVPIERDQHDRPLVSLLQLQAQLAELRARQRPTRHERRWRAPLTP